MMLIADRGCIYGPEGDYVNHIDLVNMALEGGFMSTIDVHVEPSGVYLGAEDGKWSYKVDHNWLEINRKKLICIPTDLQTIQFFAGHPHNYHWMLQKNDDYVLTSYGYIWVSNNAPVDNKVSFIVNSSIAEIPDSLSKVAGICSNCIGILKENGYE